MAGISNEEVVMRFPARQTLLRNINKIQNRQRPLNPRALADVVIEYPYSTAYSGEPFLQFDSGGGENRLLSFLLYQS